MSESNEKWHVRQVAGSWSGNDDQFNEHPTFFLWIFQIATSWNWFVGLSSNQKFFDTLRFMKIEIGRFWHQLTLLSPAMTLLLDMKKNLTNRSYRIMRFIWTHNQTKSISLLENVYILDFHVHQWKLQFYLIRSQVRSDFIRAWQNISRSSCCAFKTHPNSRILWGNIPNRTVS